ncbi:hypothetical protein [Spirosoma foliorum]|uniref:Uncharacterized protein n=1 Tax=Spirosoma foliorum TaxID=2710596 RepID=A0A7G5H2L6_9BACT|nr:hypothetical protein [Spirosoma foliorum]QMW05358.1 hypothetical protein H3H32_10935 [Spirosoma foliorum]
MRTIIHLGQTIEAESCDQAGPYVNFRLNTVSAMYRINGGRWMGSDTRSVIKTLEALTSTKTVEEFFAFCKTNFYPFDGDPEYDEPLFD